MRRITVVRAAVALLFVAGATLLIVGTAGTATPLIVAGVVLVIAGGAAGFVCAMEPRSGTQSPLTASTPLVPQPSS
jgi:hypothetical protein